MLLMCAAVAFAAGGAWGQEQTSTSTPTSTSTSTKTSTSTSTSTGTRTTLTVSYRSQTAVYVSGGRADGLAIGDRLGVMAGQDKVAELEVVFLAEHSSSCKVISEARPVKPGDKLVRLGAPRAAAPASPAPREIVLAPASPPPAPYVPASPRTGSEATRVTGGAAVGWGTFRDTSSDGRDTEERQARLDLAVRNLGGYPVEARLRGSGRQIDRSGPLTQAARPSDSRQRLYEASLAWAPRDGMFSLAAGRLGAHPFVALGFLDGVMGEVRPGASVQVGGFAGRTPDAYDVGLPTGSKYGAYLRLGAYAGATPAELVVSGAREMAGSEVSREWVGQQAQLRRGSVWLYERAEVDVNRGWRRDRAGQAATLSEARVLLSWRASAQADLSLSYDLSRNYWSALTRVLTSDQLDQRLRQTVRAELALARAGGVGLWAGASARTIEGEDEASFAAHGGLRSPRLAALDVSLDGSYYRTPGTQGVMATARAGRSLRGGHRLELSYIGNRYTIGGGGARLSHWLRASGYGQAGRAFGRADLEWALQDDLPGVRALAEIGWRF